MNAKLPILFIVLFASLNVHCTLNETESPANLGATNDSISKAEWTIIDSIDYETLNADIVPGKPTMDVGVYLPSNLDPEFKKVTLDRMLTGLRAAKEIYAPTGVQVNVLWIKTGEIDPSFLSIQANEVPGIPNRLQIDHQWSLNVDADQQNHPSRSRDRISDFVLHPWLWTATNRRYPDIRE